MTTQADVDAGKVAVIAPEGFTEHAVQENVYAGTAMARRAAYMYGAVLARGPQGQVGCGLGQAASTGEVALIVPTVDIRTTGETHTFDGVEIEFQMAPGTEAPAEMHFYFPKFRALCMAENATHNLHNLLTLRGALVRDPHGWAGYLTEAIDTFADRADVVFASHHWPTWGTDSIVEFLSLQRDLYAYLHDQTLRQLNQGFTGSRSPRRSRCRPRWRRRGTPTATTARSATTSRRSTSATWAGSTATRAGCGRTRRRRSARATSRRWAASTAWSRLPQNAFDDGDFRWAATLLDHAIFTDQNHAGGPGAVRRHARAAGLRRGERRVAQLLPLRRDRTARGQLRHPDADRVAVDPGPAHAGADVRHASRSASTARRAWDLDLAIDITFTRRRHQLPADAAQRRAGAPQGAPPIPSTATATVTLANKLRLLVFAAGDAASPGLEISGDADALAVAARRARPARPGFNIVTP